MTKLFKLFAVMGLFATTALSLNSDAQAAESFTFKAKVNFVTAEAAGLEDILKLKPEIMDKPVI